jgi:hypothetical protein
MEAILRKMVKTRANFFVGKKSQPATDEIS